MTDMLTIQDCRDAGFCINPGVKKVCETHGLDFRTMVREGVLLSVAEGMNDLSIRRAVAIAKKRIQAHG